MAIFSTGFTPETMTLMLNESETRDQEGNPLHLVLFIGGKTVFIKDLWEINGILFFEVEDMVLVPDGGFSNFPPTAMTILDLRKESQWWGDLFKGAFIHTVHTFFLQGLRRQVLLRKERDFTCLSSN